MSDLWQIDPDTQAEPETVGARPLALKDGDMFVVASAGGDILGGTEGLYSKDTRVLSHLEITVGGHRPSLLSATVSRDSVVFTAHATNAAYALGKDQAVPRGVLHIERTRLLWRGSLHERVLIENYSDIMFPVSLSVAFDADFRDIFEVRGARRWVHGQQRPVLVDGHRVALGYVGRDETVRTTIVSFSPLPERLSDRRADYRFDLAGRSRQAIYLEIGVEADAAYEPSAHSFRMASAQARRAVRHRRRGGRVITAGRIFNSWIERSRADLAILTTDLPTGPFPYAGVPWFSSTFGRDAIITALQMLWLDPSIARGVLAFLCETQAQVSDGFRDSQPGKILHEMRRGEMAATGEVPFARYYGSVDATPLFLVLLSAYVERTADLEFALANWRHAQTAMQWMAEAGLNDENALIKYARAGSLGLVNQGWKDSHDAIFRRDGSDPVPPIALVEVQGYAYAALQGMAALAGRLGKEDDAQNWQARGDRLRAAVEEKFWMPEADYYGLAVDGAQQLCRVRTSNAGHLLYVGLPSHDRGRKVADALASAAFNSGWGVRTLAVGEARYNPMSYHNGSVWPHDTAIAAAGAARYGRRDLSTRLLSQMFEAAIHFEFRLPELFCGFPKMTGGSPIAYPVACLPQSWAAGALFMMLQASLGIRIDGWSRRLTIDRPVLPPGVDQLRVERVPVGGAMLDVEFQRISGRIVVSSSDREARAGAEVSVTL